MIHARFSYRFLECLLVALLAWQVGSADVVAQGKGKGGLENDVLYYVVIDRFYDGTRDNNIPDYAFPVEGTMDEATRHYNQLNRTLIRSSYDPSRRYMGLYWGGDLRGVIEKLPYLRDLGITKIVVSPILENANGWLYNPNQNYALYLNRKEDGAVGNHYAAHMSTGYHGYWTKDWYEIDEHFRDPDSAAAKRFDVFKELLDKAHASGIGVILDLTLNHTSSVYPTPDGKTPTWRLDDYGAIFADYGAVYKNGQLVARAYDPNRNQWNPDQWFHPRFDIDFRNPSKQMLEEGMLPGGLPDLNQRNPAVRDYLFGAVTFWLEFNKESAPIAGFRLDAIKHVNLSFWQALEWHVKSVNPNAVLFGEYFDGGYRNPDSIDFVSQTQSSSMFDFDLSNSVRRFFAGERNWAGRTFMIEETCLGREGRAAKMRQEGGLLWFVRRLANVAQNLDVPKDSLDRVSDDDAAAWVTFLESHDFPRMKSFYPNMSDEAYKSAIRFLFVARGVPMLMYGTETALAIPYHPKHEGFGGMGGDPFNRPMMIWPGDPGWKADVYDVTKQMVELRKRYSVLRYGKTRFIQPRGASPTGDLFMLREPYGGQLGPVSVLYAYSTKGGKFAVNLQTWQIGASSYELASCNESVPVRGDVITIDLRPEEAKVLVLSNK